MKCPACLSEDNSVKDSRDSNYYKREANMFSMSTRRRVRQCRDCKTRWKTHEVSGEDWKRINEFYAIYLRTKSIFKKEKI